LLEAAQTGNYDKVDGYVEEICKHGFPAAKLMDQFFNYILKHNEITDTQKSKIFMKISVIIFLDFLNHDHINNFASSCSFHANSCISFAGMQLSTNGWWQRVSTNSGFRGRDNDCRGIMYFKKKKIFFWIFLFCMYFAFLMMICNGNANFNVRF